MKEPAFSPKKISILVCEMRRREVPAYTERELLSDLGGTMGLFLGLSIHGTVEAAARGLGRLAEGIVGRGQGWYWWRC